jgi:hypothetical protein
MTATELAIIVNSALYLAGCIAAGLATGNRVAWTLAIADAGVLYLGYLAMFDRRLTSAAEVCWLMSTVALGALAGIALLF